MKLSTLSVVLFAAAISASPIGETSSESGTLNAIDPVSNNTFEAGPIAEVSPEAEGLNVTESSPSDISSTGLPFVTRGQHPDWKPEELAGPLNGDVAPPPGAKPPPPDKECKAYVSRVWDWNAAGLHRHKFAYWCDNCPENIDMFKGGDLWSRSHAAKECVAINNNQRVYWDEKWKKWVVDTSEVHGVGDESANCMMYWFQWKWGTYACGFGEKYEMATRGSGPIDKWY